jgi:hypothetical protein
MRLNLLFTRIAGHDWAIAITLFLLGLGSRIPFVSQMAFSSDSARFALALHHYDVTQMRPHAPGYFLYVAAAKLLYLVWNDATGSLVAVSAISSGVAAALTFSLACSMYGRMVALASALLLLTSPVFWYNGEMPLTYALEGALTIAVAAACYRVIIGERSWLLPAAILLGITGGVKQTLLFVLAPMLLYAITKCRMKQVIVAVLACVGTCLVWLIPMVVLSGGLAKYVAAVSAQYNTWVKAPVPLSVALWIRTIIFLRYMKHGLWLGLMPVAYFCVCLFVQRERWRDERVRLLLLWLIPSAIYLVGLNIFNPGHVVFMLPALFIIAGEGARAFSAALEKSRTSWAANAAFAYPRRVIGTMLWRDAAFGAIVCVIAVVNACMFFLGTGEASYGAIRQADQHLAGAVHLARARFNADRSMIITCRQNTQAGLYLPEFLICCPLPIIFAPSEVPIELQNVYWTRNYETTPNTYWTATGFRIEPIRIPEGVNTLILWDEEIAGYCRNTDRLERVGGGSPAEPVLYYLRAKPGERLSYDYHRLQVN